MPSPCLFCKIIEGQAPARIIYEDDRVVAFEDIHPQAPTHVLIVPRKHVASLGDAAHEDAPLIGHMHLVAAQIAQERNITKGYRTLLNNGPLAGQSVYHLHLHLLGGRGFGWPPG